MNHSNNIHDLEKKWIEGVRNSDALSFRALFDRYYVQLSSFATEYVKSYDAGREVAQEVFIKIWASRESFSIDGSLKSYLYRAVYHQALNYIEKENKRRNYEQQAAIRSEESSEGADDRIIASEVRIAIREAVRQLPPKRNLVFVLHRQHGLSIKEVAQVLNVSPKTVENQMTEAMKFLRDKLNQKKI